MNQPAPLTRQSDAGAVRNRPANSVAHPLRLDYVQLKKRLGGVAKLQGRQRHLSAAALLIGNFFRVD